MPRGGRRRFPGPATLGVTALSLLILHAGPRERSLSAGTLAGITSVNPSSAYNFRATTITISGSGFDATTSVALAIGTTFLQLDETFVDSTTLRAVVPADLPGGPYTVVVTNPDSSNASLPNGFTVLFTGDGTHGQWQGVALMNHVRDATAVAVRNRTIYAVGGVGGVPPFPGAGAFDNLSSAEYTTVNVDGTLSPWTFTSSLPTPLVNGAAAAWGNYLYAAGGGVVDVTRAAINSDGSLNAWQADTPFPAPRSDIGLVAVVGYLYAIGGTQVDRAAINADGSLGAWTTLSPIPRSHPGRNRVFVAGQHIYVVGDGTDRAAVNADGSLGTWEKVEDGAFGIQVAASTRGVVFWNPNPEFVGGSAFNEDSRYGLIHSNTAAITFNRLPQVQTQVASFAFAAVDGFLYHVGGYTTGARRLPGVVRGRVSPLSVSAAAAVAATPTTITVAGNNFVPPATVSIDGGASIATTFVSATGLTVNIPGGFAAGGHSLTVTNADGQQQTVADGFFVDAVPPSGTIVINSGVTVTASRDVTLTLSATDNRAGVAEMAFSNDSTTFTAYEPYATSKAWTLADADGTQPVYVRFRDAVGNASGAFSDSIELDRRPPTGSITINVGAAVTPGRTVSLTCAASAAIAASIVANVRFSNDNATWSDWQTFRTGGITWDLTAGNGIKTVFVRFRDSAGNENLASAGSDAIELDADLPSGSPTINAGAITTVSTLVYVRVSASPGTGGGTVTGVSFSNDGTAWSAWETGSAADQHYPWTVPAGDGLKTVYARVRDSLGNESLPASDTITLKTTLSSNTISINDGDLYTNSVSVTLSLGAPPPATLGTAVAEMQISNDGGFAGSAWEPYASHRAWTITSVGAAIIPRVVYARFRALGGATTATFQDDIVLDTTAPSGSVVVSSAGTSLLLSASDDVSGVADMAVSRDAVFTAVDWEPFASSKAWMPGGDAFVRFRDYAGNVSPIVTPAGPADPAAPFGSWDIPADQANVSGAFPIGGWALDDVGVTGVHIYRDPVAGESFTGPVFVGTATFVAGSRPDVEAVYSTAPSANQAGWGYMFLTNGLPNGGNGAFTLSVYAEDGDGRRTILDRRTINSDNATSTLPFGTIDTPAQGETVAGGSYVNFGWALTPQPNSIPSDGSTITVFVDGAPVGNPAYNHPRQDLMTVFPGLANTNGAVGYFLLDTTQYADGLHTIAWSVTDSAGTTQGLGSRYFRVQNGVVGGAITEAAAAALAVAADATAPSNEIVVTVRTGYDADATPFVLDRDDSGSRSIEITEQRLVITVSAPLTDAYLMANAERQALPVGSTLDRAAGTFTWEPGAAFNGPYHFVFVAGDTRLPVTIVVRPR